MLSCKANGVPAASLKWYFEDKELKKGENVEFFAGGIILRKVKKEQAGSYGCIFVQELGSFKHVQERDIKVVVQCESKK